MAATIHVVVAATVMPFLSIGYASSSSSAAPTCSKGQVVNAAVTVPRTVLQMKCPAGYTVKPSDGDNVNSVFTDSNCSNESKLCNLCPGATGTQTTSDGAQLVTLNFEQLPKTPTTFYIQCFKASDDTCQFLVAVSGAPLAGPQVCALKDSSVDLVVRGRGGSAQFACGKDLQLQPTSVTRVYNEDCTKEKDLKGLKLSGSNDRYYVLTAEGTPKSEKLCYLCASASFKKNKEESCAVLIDVSAGSGLAARSAVGAALPCVLALLHFT